MLRTEKRWSFYIRVITQKGKIVTMHVKAHDNYEARKKVLANPDIRRVIHVQTTYGG